MASDNHQTRTSTDEDAITTERTPLLASSPVTRAGTEGDAEESKALLSSTSSSPAPTTAAAAAADSSHKPLPKTQILLLCYARLIEPMAFFSIFPYINQMVLSNGGGRVDEADMGFYSGLIESLFSLTQMLIMVSWGRAADRVGRKPVLVFSLLGVAVSTALFGLARSIPQMIIFRCAAGVFAGSIVTVRTMISENSTRQTQARAFAWFAVAGNLGIFVGPFIGGALADPATQYPRVFGGVWFFETFPYALSSITVGVVGLTAVLTSALFLRETLPRDARSAADDNETGAAAAAPHPPPPASTWELLRAPGVGIVLYNYGHVMLLAYAYTAIVPVFWATRVGLGGLGFTPLHISLFMGLTGLSQTTWLLAVFPPLQHRIGTNGVMRLCGIAYPFFLGLMPLLNLLLRLRTRAGVTAFWIVAPTLLSLGPGVSMSFTAAQLALNDVSPSQETLGMLNALALTLVSGLRSFSPALFASLFAVGVGNQFLSGYFIWVIMVILALGFTVSSRFMPAASEKDAVSEDSYGDDGGHDDDSDVTVRG